MHGLGTAVALLALPLAAVHALNNGFTKPGSSTCLSHYGPCPSLTVPLPHAVCVCAEMGFNTWESWGCDISEQKIHAAADAMVTKGLLDAGCEHHTDAQRSAAGADR